MHAAMPVTNAALQATMNAVSVITDTMICVHTISVNVDANGRCTAAEHSDAKTNRLTRHSPLSPWRAEKITVPSTMLMPVSIMLCGGSAR